MDICTVLYFVGALLVLFFVWYKFADADFSLLLLVKFGRGVESLQGKVIWITGASSGIGEHLAYTLAKVGVDLALSGTNVKNLTSVQEKCLEIGKKKGTRVLLVPFNVRDFSIHEQQLSKVTDFFGKVDVLVNNAGLCRNGMFESDSSQEFERDLFDVNVFGPVSLARLVVRHFKQRQHRGQVVVTSSMAGRTGIINASAYCASKHAVHGYFQTLALEGSLSVYGPDVTIACPGPVETRMWAATPKKFQLEAMSTSRCAQLIAIAMANKVGETWIIANPLLLLMYTPRVLRRWAYKLLPRNKARKNEE
ncbi:dehydrogenase/reductase SDR family member 7 [Ixodes scapularis]|uniref:dehydrogenase/reductase SDR family member 7 n=1 Tax=Ixodes scapularis TaxID=6945 RepID=UPI001A9EAC15|nr:dehydrogenase/reductase SDR family member 7 [Ixodes scapularis]